MRSSWMNRLFRHESASGRISGQLSLSLAVLPPRKVIDAPAAKRRAANPPGSTRLCLGIGDGSLHRQ